MKNLSVIIASLDDTSPDRRGIGSPVRFPSNFNQSQQNDTSLPRAPLPGELARQRLRGWTKDAFRLSGITQVLLCTTSPTSSLRSMPPPLAGEALAFRDVFQQTQISFIENDTSLPRAPLLGKTPPAGGGGTQVPKGERLASEVRLRGLILFAFGLGRKLGDRKSTRLNSSHNNQSRMPSSA